MTKALGSLVVLTALLILLGSGTLGCKGKDGKAKDAASGDKKDAGKTDADKNKGTAAAAKSKKDMIVGTWEITDGGEIGPPKGTTMEFTADGNLITKMNDDGKEMKTEAKYEVAGDQLKVTHTSSISKKESTDTTEIKTLTATELVIADKDITMKLKKK